MELIDVTSMYKIMQKHECVIARAMEDNTLWQWMMCVLCQ